MAVGKGVLYGNLTAATTTTGGDALGLANPEGADLLITRFMLNITTAATGSANVDAGVAADATTSADDLIDGADVGSAAAIFDNIDDQGTNGQSLLEWGSDEYVTVTPSATLAGLVGKYYIEYVHA